MNDYVCTTLRLPSKIFLATLHSLPPTVVLYDREQPGKMGKKGKRGGIPTVKKSYFKRLDDVAKEFEEELKEGAADLFQPLPPTEDCPICCTPLSRLEWNSHYQPCCGNTICNGCHGERTAFIKKVNAKNQGTRDDDGSNTCNKKLVVDACPFCREPMSALAWITSLRSTLASRAIVHAQGCSRARTANSIARLLLRRLAR